MGFIKAFTGALGGAFADQWKDFYKPMEGVPSTAAIYPAVPVGTNNGRGQNTKGSEHVITNGSKIIVPEGTALITLQDGAITGCIAEPGGFIFKSDDPNSQSMFAGDGIIGQVAKSTWEKVKFGGQPGSQQLAFYVNLKEIPGNNFGTQGPIYWDDAYLNAQVGAVTRGTYTLKIVDETGANVFTETRIDVLMNNSNSSKQTTLKNDLSITGYGTEVTKTHTVTVTVYNLNTV